MSKNSGLLMVLLLASVSGFGWAQPAPARAAASAKEPLEITLTRSKVAIVDGKEVLQDAASAKPGDILEESARYTNVSKAPLNKLEATLPVPPNTELVMASIRPANALASADGKNFSAMPLKRKLKQANGVEVEQAVPLTEYRFLRWLPGEIDSGKSLVFSARFKVADNNGSAAAVQKK